MTTEETIEGNKLIRQFMEHGYLPYRIDYCKQWNDLMPVVQKILETDIGTLDVYSLYVCDSLSTAKIESVWLAVIEFIEWYNQSK